MQTNRPTLVLGGSGQVGHELLGHLSSSSPLLAPTRQELDLGNLRAVSQYVNEHRPARIFNAAAYTAVDMAEREPVAAYRINAELPGALGEAAARIGAAVVHYSTDYVFNGMSDVPYKETDAAVPLNVYGATKLAGEQALRATGAASLVFRTSWVYGALGSNFALTVRRRLAKGETLRVVDDQHGAPTWCRDIAVGSVACADQLAWDTGKWQEQGGVYHLSAGGETTWFGFASALASLFHPTAKAGVEPITSGEYPVAARRPRNSLLNNELVGQVFGVHLPTWSEPLSRVFTD